MKKLLLALILSGTALAQTTPNMKLYIPAQGTLNWDTLMNAEFTKLDAVIGINVDGTAYTSIQAAISALPAAGGVVRIPCGTFAGPTTIPSNTHLVSVCDSVPKTFFDILGISSQTNASAGGTVFTYSAALTLTRVSNVWFTGITLDFQGNNGGLVVNSSSFNRFEGQIQNCGTSACLTLTTVSGASGTGADNVVGNEFPSLKIYNAAKGILLNGSTNPSAGSYVTLNSFNDVYISHTSTSAIECASGCDTNYFRRVWIQDLGLAGNGIVMNTTNVAIDQDANFNRFDFLSINFTGGVTTGYPILLNNSIGNYFGIAQGAGGATTNTPEGIQVLNGAQYLSMRMQSAASRVTSDIFATREGGLAFAVPFAGLDACAGDSNSHTIKCSYNGGTYASLTQTIGTGSVTTAGTAILTGACQAQTNITVTGTAVTDAVSANIGAALPATWQTGIQLSAHPTATNTVTVYLCNPTAGSVTPAATAVNVRVTR